MDRRRLREAATCPLGDHRSTEHRGLFRPTGIGLRRAVRALSLSSFNLSRSLRLPRAPPLAAPPPRAFPEYLFLFFSPPPRAREESDRNRDWTPNECPRVYARGDARLLRGGRLKKIYKDNRERHAISRLSGEFIPRFFTPIICEESFRNARWETCCRAYPESQRSESARMASIKSEFLRRIKSSFHQALESYLPR